MADDPIVTRALNQTKPGRDLHDQLVRRYDRSYEIYRASQKRTRAEGAWESDLRIPYGRQVIDTVLVNILGGKPRARIKPARPGDEQAAKSMQRALDYYVRRDHLADSQVPYAQQGLIYNVTAAKNQWLYKEITRPARKYHPNPLDPNQPLAFQIDETVTLDDRPSFEPWDVYDLWWEPNARNVDTAAYVVLRSWLTKDEVLSLQKTKDNPHGYFENVDALLKVGSSGATETRAQDRFLTGGQDKRKDRFEIWEIWTDDLLTVVGERAVLLRQTPNPFWHGRKPIVIATVRPDIFKIEGAPMTDLIGDLQEAMWSVHNLRIDNMNMTVNTGLTYRESGIIDPARLKMKPRFMWPVTDHDDVMFQKPDALPPEAYREDDVMLGRLQLVTGVNPYISGADTSGADQNTATGVTALQEVASRLLKFMASQLQSQGLQRTFEQWIGLTRQFLTEDMAIRIDGPGDAYSWHTLKPQDVVGEFDITVEGTEESLSRQSQRGEVMGLLQALAPFAPLNIINFKPIIEKVAEAFDFAAPESLLALPPPPPQQAAPTGGQPNGVMPTPGAQPPQVPQMPPAMQHAYQGHGPQGG